MSSIVTPDCSFSQSAEEQSPESCRLQEKDCHHDRCYIFDHENIELLPGEFFSVSLYFICHPAGPDDPADQNARKHSDKGHHKAVADVVHNVKKLSDRTVRETDLHIEDTVTQRNHGCGDKIEE